MALGRRGRVGAPPATRDSVALLVPPVIVTASMLVSNGQVRHRVICEPIVVVLAAQFLTSRVRATAVG